MELAETMPARQESQADRRHSALVSNAAPRVLLPDRRRRVTAARRGSWHATNAESSPRAPRAPATGARSVSPRPERQADAVAFLVERHVVHEVTNDEQPAPVLALEVTSSRKLKTLRAPRRRSG